MADEDRFTDGLEFLSETFYDADGNVVDDPKKAVRGSVVVRYPDGRIAHHTLVSDRMKEAGSDERPEAEADAPKPRVVRRK